MNMKRLSAMARGLSTLIKATTPTSLDTPFRRVPMFTRLFSAKGRGNGGYPAIPDELVFGDVFEGPYRKRSYRFEHSEEDVKSEEKLWELYQRWLTHFKATREPDEINEHYEIFKRRAKSTLEFNKKGMSYKKGLTQFADWSEEELNRMCGGEIGD